MNVTDILNEIEVLPQFKNKDGKQAVNKTDDLRSEKPAEKIDNSRIIFDADWVLDQFFLMDHPPMTRGLARCQDCLHFQRNPHSPDVGIGRCQQRPEGHPDRGMWPRPEHNCMMFESGGHDQ